MKLKDGNKYILQLQSIFGELKTCESECVYDEGKNAFYGSGGGKITMDSKRFIRVVKEVVKVEEKEEESEYEECEGCGMSCEALYEIEDMFGETWKLCIDCYGTSKYGIE